MILTLGWYVIPFLLNISCFSQNLYCLRHISFIIVREQSLLHLWDWSGGFRIIPQIYAFFSTYKVNSRKSRQKMPESKVFITLGQNEAVTRRPFKNKIGRYKDCEIQKTRFFLLGCRSAPPSFFLLYKRSRVERSHRRWYVQNVNLRLFYHLRYLN